MIVATAVALIVTTAVLIEAVVVVQSVVGEVVLAVRGSTGVVEVVPTVLDVVAVVRVGLVVL